MKYTFETRPGILVITQDAEVGTQVMKICESANFTTVLANTFDAACDLILKGNFQAILSDDRLQDDTAINVLYFLRKISSVPFIILTEAIGNWEAKAEALLNTVTILKPFKDDDLIGMLKKMVLGLREEPELSVELVECQEPYVAVDINEFISGKQLKHDVYIKIHAQKFVKLAEGSFGFSDQQVEKLKEKGVAALYLTKKDFQDYLAMNVRLIGALPSMNIPPEKRSTFIKQTSKILSEKVMTQEVDAEILSHSLAVVNATLKQIFEHDRLFLALEMLKDTHQNVYAHSLNVALFSSMIAKQMNWNSYQTQLKLAAAGMFHDVGLIGLPSEILEIPSADLTEEEAQSIQSHVLLSAELLRSMKGVPDDLITIIEQHHDHESVKNTSHTFSSIIHVADDFCYLMALKKPCLTNILDSIKFLENEAGAKYDSLVLFALRSIFKPHRTKVA